MVDKKLVATTVSSRETGLQRRINQESMSSQNEQNDRQEEKKNEMNGIRVSFRRKDSKKVFF